MNKTGLFLVEYSPAQGCFHIDPLERCVGMNYDALSQGRFVDYIPIGLFESNEQAHDFVEKERRLYGQGEQGKGKAW